VFTPGALFPTNRTAVIDGLDRIDKSITLSTNPAVRKGDLEQGLEELKRIGAQVTMPNGEKSYGFLEGLSPGRFAFHPKFDVLMYEYVEPVSYDVRYPPAENIEEPGAQRFYELFTNVNAFLTSQ